MNLLVPALVAAVALSAYVSSLSEDRSKGDDRRVAADSMVRYHEAAIVRAVQLFPIALNPAVAIPVAPPFINVLSWDSALATDTQGRVWVLTYDGTGVAATPTSISDAGKAGVSFELKRLGFRSGTHGFWTGGPVGTLASTIGAVTFAGGAAPPVPDGAFVVATLCQVELPATLRCV